MQSTQPFCLNVAGQRRDHPKRKRRRSTSSSTEYSLTATTLLCLACDASITSPVVAASLRDSCLISERNCNRHANRRQRRGVSTLNHLRRTKFSQHQTTFTRSENEPRSPRSFKELNERLSDNWMRSFRQKTTQSHLLLNVMYYFLTICLMSHQLRSQNPSDQTRTRLPTRSRRITMETAFGRTEDVKKSGSSSR